MAMGGSNMQNACKCCATHPRQQSTNVESLGRSGLVSSSNWPPKSTTTTTMIKQCRQSDIDNDGDDSNGRDSNGNGNGEGDGDDAAAAANVKDVNDEDSSVSRMAIGRRQLDDDNGTMTM
jgi:hypothetical protein